MRRPGCRRRSGGFQLSRLHSLLHRTSGLLHRGLASLRARGWRATWARVRRHFQRLPAAQKAHIVAPDARAAMPALPANGTPRASIVIPVYGQLAHTLDCLRMLAAHPPSAAVEVIVVDDASPDGSAEALAGIDGLRLHRRAANGGFIAACNDGARIARGDVVVFLNNDTWPQPGWLDALLETFDAVPAAGIVGAHLLDADGTLQDAGGRVFADGSAANLGRGASPNDPRHAVLRDVDYACGAALAIDRALFAAVGGFDTRYAPAYYEDTDLAFRVRAAGRRVLVQPAAQVVHLEGATSGTDVRHGVKQHQVRNQRVFAETWHDVLAAHPPPGGAVDPAAGPGPRVLVVDVETPRPQHDSASLRLVNLMRLLQAEGAHVTFLPRDGNHAGDATRALQALGIAAWYAPFASTAPAWLQANADAFDTVVLCRHHLADELLPLVRRHAPRARVVFDTVDLHHLREQRAAELAGDAALARAALRTRERELALVAACDATLVVSEVERALLADARPAASVHVVSNVHADPAPVAGPAGRRDVLFIGGFRHPPNVDAVLWFGRQVWPRVRARLPALQWHCIGADPPAEVRALGGETGIVVHGHVPDLMPWLGGARLTVAPLRFGAGVKGKVNQSMAHGVPVVATPCAVEAMHLHDGVDVLVAEDAAAFADAVVRLASDDALWLQLSHAGQANVRAHFSFDAARAAVRAALLR